MNVSGFREILEMKSLVALSSTNSQYWLAATIVSLPTHKSYLNTNGSDHVSVVK